MAPPELTGDTPVLDALQPVQIDLFKTFRDMSELAVLRDLDRRFREFFHLYEPLLGYHILDDRMAAIAGSHRDDLFFGLDQITGSFQIGYPVFPAFVTVLTLVFSCQRVHRRVLVDAGNDRQSRTLSDLEVVRVVRRSDLDRAGTFFRIRIRVGDDRDLLADQRQDDFLADDRLVAFIIRMDRDGLIGEHGLRSGCRDDDTVEIRGRLYSRIFEIPILAVLVFVFDFRIRKRRTALRTPVDQTVAPVDQTFLI